MPRVRLLLLIATSWLTCSNAFPADSADALILAAGNAHDESLRLSHLRTLSARGDAFLDPVTRAELAAVLPVVAAWAEGRMTAAKEIAQGNGEAHRYLHQFFNNATRPFDPPFPTPPRTDSPLYPLWAFYRARFLTWFMIEHSEVLAVPEKKTAFLGEAER